MIYEINWQNIDIDNKQDLKNCEINFIRHIIKKMKIAEGLNHNGDEKYAIKLVDEIFKHEVDAITFQIREIIL